MRDLLQHARPDLLLILLLVGCNAETAWTKPPPGVTVVTNPARTEAPMRFTASKSATRSFDLDAAGIEWQHGIHSGLIGPHGGLVYLNGVRVALFDPEGTPRAVVGREGSGPGEFRNIVSGCVTRGDTVIVDDVSLQRITIIDARAAMVVRAFPDTIGLLEARGCFDDGTFLVRTTKYHEGTRDRHVVLRRYDTEGHLVSTLLEFDRPRSRQISGAYPEVAASGTTWYFVDPHYSEARRYDLTGKLIRIIRTRDPVQEVDEDKGRGTSGAAPASGPGIQHESELSGRGRVPFWSAIRTGPSGGVWLRDPPNPDDIPLAWTRFDSTGTLLGRYLPEPGDSNSDVHPIGFSGNDVWLGRFGGDGQAVIEIHRLVAMHGTAD